MDPATTPRREPDRSPGHAAVRETLAILVTFLSLVSAAASPAPARGQTEAGGGGASGDRAGGAAAAVTAAPDTAKYLLERSVSGLLPDSLRTEVLVLGTTHLSRYADRFRPALLDRLIEALEDWGPAAIGVERDPPDVYARIGADEQPGAGRAVQRALGIDLERAVVTADSLLAATSAAEDVSAEARLELVRHLVAAHRLPTATLHWTRLPEELRSGADLPEEARQALEAGASGPANEIYSIGVRLALERGLARVHPVDDHTSGRVYDLERAASEEGLRELLASHPMYDSVQAFIDEARRRAADAIEAGDLLPFYRWRNRPRTVTDDTRGQWGIWMALAPQTPAAQKRIAHWEIRNLKMVTHIRKMTLHHPGERVLVVVGAGHKAFFDAYLDRMLDVEIVHLDEVLDAAAPRDGSAGARP